MLKRKIEKLDKFILFILVCLVACGTLSIYEATRDTKLEGLHINNLYLFAFFCIPMLVIFWIDYKALLGKILYIGYAMGIGLLVALKFAGENINGAVRWLNIGPFQLQPSELVKIFTILLVAQLLSRRQGEQLRLFKDLLPVCIVFMIPTILIMKQPDLGTALVFVGVLISMLWMGNIRLLYMILFISIMVTAIVTIFWLYNANQELLARFVEPHQMSRIQTFLDPASDPDKSWHVKNAMRAISSGGLSGGDGYYIEKGFIPYAYSDSIYVVIGENYGFLGSAVLLVLYFLLIYRMIQIVIESKDYAGAYIVIGIVGMLAFQIFVNIGMLIGLVPLTGISLPFISYGGSSLFSNMLAIGLVLSVHAHNGNQASS